MRRIEMAATAVVIERKRGPRRFWASLDSQQRRTVLIMAAVVSFLHLAGFGILYVLLVSQHAPLESAGAFTLGIGVTAYTLGMRHAFDADHIAAIDNTTRKLISEGKRPLSVGFWFSLGHSTVVFGLAFVLSVGVRSLAGPLRNGSSGVHQAAGWIGTLVSGTFLYAIAVINVVILFGIIAVFREMKSGRYDELELERQLASRGLMNRFLGRLTKTVSKPEQMYPVGVLFGLGFDTATEVALLVLAGGAASAALPWYAILCLPILFAAGMSLLDTIDGSFMNFAYSWAFSKPVRKVFYNITITALSVTVALVIGTIELGGLFASRLGLSGVFWSWFENININLLGFVIVAMFVATWVIALAIWRLGRIEERWSAHLDRPSRATTLVGNQATGESYTIAQHVFPEAEAVRS
jgi:high-affinity nickel-transport protein